MVDKNKKVSIIVPVYNVEKYLQRCIESILAQTFTDFELLLIDDGSKDKSGDICDKYAARDSRIRVFHKKNGGVSSARNLGIEHAKGEWITFVDSDDWLEIDYIAQFTQDSDLCVQGYYNGDAKILYENVHVDQHIGAFYMKKPYVFGPYCKLFKTSIIRKNKIEFDVQLSFGEDVLFLMQYALYCHNMRIVANVGYHYRKSVENSLSVRERSYEDMIIQYSKHLSAFEAIMKGVKSEKKEIRSCLKGTLCDLLDKSDKSCNQILYDSPTIMAAFERFFLPCDKIMYLYIPRFAIWQNGMQRRLKRHLSKFNLFLKSIKFLCHYR